MISVPNSMLRHSLNCLKATSQTRLLLGEILVGRKDGD